MTPLRNDNSVTFHNRTRQMKTHHRKHRHTHRGESPTSGAIPTPIDSEMSNAQLEDNYMKTRHLEAEDNGAIRNDDCPTTAVISSPMSHASDCASLPDPIPLPLPLPNPFVIPLLPAGISHKMQKRSRRDRSPSPRPRLVKSC